MGIKVSECDKGRPTTRALGRQLDKSLIRVTREVNRERNKGRPTTRQMGRHLDQGRAVRVQRSR